MVRYLVKMEAKLSLEASSVQAVKIKSGLKAGKFTSP